MSIVFRPAHPQDFDYCARLYAEDVARYIHDPEQCTAKVATLRPRWHVGQVRIIVLDGTDIGWLQGAVEGDAFFIIQFVIEDQLRGGGTGSAVLTSIIDEAAAAGRDVTLEVVKENRALRLYRRFGFQITHESEGKYGMRRARSG